MMISSRRKLLRLAALTGAGAIAGCARNEAAAAEEPPANGITPQTVAEAEKLQGISFTPAERALMIEDVEGSLETLAALRAMEMPNALAPALTFDPRSAVFCAIFLRS